MANNSIGQFIAALRKSSGMTQQEVADRLNVSNKAVSRWERDECAPDITLIPAIAEVFGVTCDELLKGERIHSAPIQEKKEPKIEKQIKNLVRRTISSFKNLLLIALAISAVGLVCMFGISYGFYRPVIAFAVMLLFEICAFAISIFAVNRAKDAQNGNELFEMAGDELICQFNSALSSFSYASFFAVLAVILLSLPLILLRSDYIESVMSPNTYFSVFFIGIILLLALIYLKLRKPYSEWMANGKLPTKPNDPSLQSRKKITKLQVGAVIIASVIFVIAPYFEFHPYETSWLFNLLAVLGLVILASNIVVFIVFVINKKEDRKLLLLPGIRNMLFIPSALIMSGMHTTGWTHYPTPSTLTERYDVWNTNCLWYALTLALVVFMVFSLIEVFIKNRSANKK